MNPSLASRHSWFEATARARINGLLDAVDRLFSVVHLSVTHCLSLSML